MRRAGFLAACAPLLLAAACERAEQLHLAAEPAASCARDFGAVAGEVLIPGGRFTMGSERFYPEEAPVRAAEVGPFRIDRHEVTNDQFAEFVAATGYVTVAERTPDASDYPDIDPAQLVPGSAVFIAPQGADGGGGWRFVPGASWRAPMGPGSTIDRMGEHPVVHVSYEDAAAYAGWRGGRLPTEAEWERAARAGLEGAAYEWGDELSPDGQWRANTWQGPFPLENRAEDGFLTTAPVGCFDESAYGLYDMTGNVWEWTSDLFESRTNGASAAGVVKGGSFLCAESYCARYRPAARQPYERDFSASHIGFRTVTD